MKVSNTNILQVVLERTLKRDAANKISSCKYLHKMSLFCIHNPYVVFLPNLTSRVSFVNTKDKTSPGNFKPSACQRPSY